MEFEFGGDAEPATPDTPGGGDGVGGGDTGMRRVVIEQDRRLGRAGMVWCAAFVLGEEMAAILSEARASEAAGSPSSSASAAEVLAKSGPRPTWIIEMGAGTGMGGLGLVATAPNVHLTLTDLPACVPLLQRNAERNMGGGGTHPSSFVHAETLMWGEPHETAPYDWVIGADCVWLTDCPLPELVQSIVALSTSHTRVVFTGRDRNRQKVCEQGQDGPLWRFKSMLEVHFARVEIRACNVTSNRNPTVCLITAEGFKGDGSPSARPSVGGGKRNNAEAKTEAALASSSPPHPSPGATSSPPLPRPRPPLPPPSSTTIDDWTWTQSEEDVEMTIPMPPEAATKKDVTVEFKTNKLKVCFTDHPDPAFDSELEHTIDPDGCSWQIDGRNLVITMEKAEDDYEAQSLGGWEAVFKGAGFCAPKLRPKPR